jgi:glycosyltransferase involved in cell wall biosynthesis
MTMARPRVVVISADRLGASMAGPAIRAYELARSLEDVADVTLAAVPGEGDPGVDFVPYQLRDARPLREHVMNADMVVGQPQWPHVHRWARASGARLVWDVYDPEPLEVFESLRGRPKLLRDGVQRLTLDRILNALQFGHHLVCASERQRDLWLGTLLGAGLMAPAAYDRDPSFRAVIDTLPFGVPAAEPRAGRDGIRARFAEIGTDDEVVLWNGGLWSWLDAPTAVRAVAELARTRPRVRLVFMGAAQHGPAQAATEAAQGLARELGVLGTHVFFNDEWVPYEQRADWLLAADAAISTHHDHLETRFAFRTRLLDCFWARLPIVCTQGDDLADRVERDGLGAAVPAEDHVAAAAALGAVLDRGRDAYRPALDAAAAAFAWPVVTEPLRRWLAEPLPPRVGAAAHRPPGRAARDTAFLAALGTMRRLGLRWPSL